MNKEEIICVKIKNQLFEQIIDILAVECNQISWKLMSSDYLSIKSGSFDRQKSSIKQISGQSLTAHCHNFGI